MSIAGRVWGSWSWIDRGVAIGLLLLGVASFFVKPLWRAADPSLALAESYFGLRRGAVKALEPLTQVADPWGRSAWLVSRRYFAPVDARVRVPPIEVFEGLGLLSAGPDGVLQTSHDGGALMLVGDDVFGGRAHYDRLGYFMLTPVATFLVGAAALSYLQARRFRPIASLPRDLFASFLLAAPAWLVMLFVYRAFSPVIPTQPWGDASPAWTVLAASTLLLFGVRRLHAPTEPAPPQPGKTEADLEAELREIVARSPSPPGRAGRAAP